MPIKSLFISITCILFVKSAAATEVLQLSKASDLFENHSCSRPRTESWSQRANVRQAIADYKREEKDLVDVFKTCENVWQKTPDLSHGQPFIGNKMPDEAGFISGAPNTRYKYISEVRVLLSKLTTNFELLTRKIDEEDYDESLPNLEIVRIETIRNILYLKVNSTNGMRDYGLTFTRVTKPEWNGKSALYRFLSIIGNPFEGQKGTLQNKLEDLLSTINT